VRGTAGGRHQQPDRVLCAHTTRTVTHHGQVRVHNRVRHCPGDSQLCRAGHGRPSGSEASTDHLRGGPGRGHVRLWRLLLCRRKLS